jgi:hypothetical protein
MHPGWVIFTYFTDSEGFVTIQRANSTSQDPYCKMMLLQAELFRLS